MSTQLQMLGQSDALAAVRRRPEMYFLNGKVTPRVLATAMVNDALLYGARKVVINLIKQSGVVVSADVDWLSTNEQGRSIADLFEQMTSNATETTPNSLRSEFLVRAFSESLVVTVKRELKYQMGAFDFGPYVESQAAMTAVVAIVMSDADIQRFA